MSDERSQSYRHEAHYLYKVSASPDKVSHVGQADLQYEDFSTVTFEDTPLFAFVTVDNMVSFTHKVPRARKFPNRVPRGCRNINVHRIL